MSQAFAVEPAMRVQGFVSRKKGARSMGEEKKEGGKKVIIINKKLTGKIKGALYRIKILCRRYTFWSYPAELTIADPPG